MCHTESHSHIFSGKLPRLTLAVALLAGWAVPTASGQVPADQQAEMILNSARKAFNEKTYPVASARFREFLAKFAARKEAPAVRYELAQSLLESPERNYNEARDLLQGLVGIKDNAALNIPLVNYHLGLAIRGQGIIAMETADAKPKEAPQHRGAALQRFQEALGPFAEASKGFEAKLPAIAPDAKELPLEVEWAARARCDQAELLLRLQKAKEAQALTVLFVKDPVFSKSKYKDQGRYFFGYASFLLKDYALAQKTLTMLTPFADIHFGNHARYLLARTHHLAEERAEAALHYQEVLNDYAKSKTAAVVQLKNPKIEVPEKAFLEAFVRNPPPDHVARASFYLGVLRYEAGRFGEAQTNFVDFLKLNPQSPLKGEAELRIGFCQVQTKAYNDAMKTLNGLAEREPALADQVQFWLGKAQAGMADPTKPADYVKMLNIALTTFRQALERAQRLQDPEAPVRRAEIQLEIADTQQHLKQFREAANGYRQLIAEKQLMPREEELMQRLAVALHLAGDFDDSDKQCKAFEEKFPKGTLLPAVLFCTGENAYFRALSKEPPPPAVASPDQAKEITKFYDDAAKRMQRLIESYPEYPKINIARYTLGLAYFRMGDLDKAKMVLNAIPAAERNDELARTYVFIADCILRQTPISLDPGANALVAGKMEDDLKTATEQLEAFVTGPFNPQTGDALLKLGMTHQRMAAILSKAPDKAKAINSARAVYTRLLGKEFAKDSPYAPQANLELAKCMFLASDPGNAMRQLQPFTTDPLKNSYVAPMALIELARILRTQNKPADAATVLNNSRQWHEAAMAKDAERAEWIPLLRYQHGVALLEAGKLPEARTVFDLVVKQTPNRLEGIESALRFGQTLKTEALQKLDEARKISQSGKKPDESPKYRNEAYQYLKTAAHFLETSSAQVKDPKLAQELRARMLYEAAWCMRYLSEPEVNAARLIVAKEFMAKLNPPSNQFPPIEVPLDKVPLQPSEKKARELYQNLIKDYGELPVATDARFELAELFALRREFDPALQLLTAVLDMEPSPDLTDKVKVRLGEVQAAKGNIKGALAHFEAVGNNPKSAMYGQAQYGAAEANLATEQYPDAIKRLNLFATQGQLQNVPGLTDRALLRLAFAYAQTKNWGESLRFNEQVVGRFPNSPWVDDARYGQAFALQQVKQLDQAINLFSQLTTRTATELGAKSQLQIGLCKREQKKYPEAITAFMTVPTTYAYPELSAAALTEAAQAHVEAKQIPQAVQLLQRVARDYPRSGWAKTAEERLKELTEKKK